MFAFADVSNPMASPKFVALATASLRLRFTFAIMQRIEYIICRTYNCVHNKHIIICNIVSIYKVAADAGNLKINFHSIVKHDWRLCAIHGQILHISYDGIACVFAFRICIILHLYLLHRRQQRPFSLSAFCSITSLIIIVSHRAPCWFRALVLPFRLSFAPFVSALCVYCIILTFHNKIRMTKLMKLYKSYSICIRFFAATARIS